MNLPLEPVDPSTCAAKPTRALASFAAGLGVGAIPIDMRAGLGDLLLDFVRVASIGEGRAWSGWARAYLDQLGGHGTARVLFDEKRRDPVRAAFLNTTYAGSIDADDTHVGSMLHPGSIVISAALSASSVRDVSGGEFVAAVVAGYEAMIRIGLSIQPTHFQRGFQSTATCGGFGAAVAAARVLFGSTDMCERRIAETIGLVASFSGGLTQFYQSGSTVKRIHAARAAENGVAAALMVQHGFSGPVDILEGSNGFARAYADGSDFDIVTNGLGEHFRMREVTLKSHACSARLMAAVEGIVDLCRVNRIAPDDIADIYVGIPGIIMGRLTIARPVDVQAAQMSLPFTLALAVTLARKSEDGFALSIRDYEASMHSEAVSAIEDRVRCVVDAEVEAATTAESVPARVTLTLRSGATHASFIPAPKGSPSRPFTHADHVARFRLELGTRWPASRCDEVVRLSEGLADLDHVSRIADLLS
jgi:2-methylcitrate dehydratase PrpD